MIAQLTLLLVCQLVGEVASLAMGINALATAILVPLLIGLVL